MKRILLLAGAIVAGVGISLTIHHFRSPYPHLPTVVQRAPVPPGERLPLINETPLLGELLRQALWLAATQHLGVSARDRSTDFSSAETELPVSIRFHLNYAVLTDRHGKEIEKLKIGIGTVASSTPDYAAAAAVIEPWADAELVDVLKKHGVFPAAVPQEKRDAVASDINDLLRQVDPQSAFLAAQRLHAEIAAHGESAERLAAIARAYSHVGESTRYLYSRHSSVFFARALLYADRAVRLYPDESLSHAARAYVYTLLTLPLDARPSFDKARERAKGALPAWAALAEDLNHLRTRALFDQIGAGDEDGLAAYFAMLTVEQSGMQSIVVRMCELALQSNSGALRIINILNDNTGVSAQHYTTAEWPQMQFRMLAQLADDVQIPKAIRDAVSTAVQNEFNADSLHKLFAAMDEHGTADGALLSWGTFSSISRDALFASGLRRLYFTDKMLGTNPQQRFNSWWPILKDHRYGPVFAGYDRSGKIGTKEAAKYVRGIDRNELQQRMPNLNDQARRLQTPTGQQPAPEWKAYYAYSSDGTVWDTTQLLLAYSGEYGAVPMVQLIKGEVAKSLQKIQPESPSAVAELISTRWSYQRDKADEIERNFGDHPQVALALAYAYLKDERFDDAIRLFEKVMALSPDPNVYASLGNVYFRKGDVDRWLQINNDYLANTPDFGLSHAHRRMRVAYTLMSLDRTEEALPYAEGAASSYSAWGLKVHAHCLTVLGRYEEAERLMEACQRRYPATIDWYYWCRVTGKGNLEAARNLSLPVVREATDSGQSGPLRYAAMFYITEGQRDLARKCWEGAVTAKTDGVNTFSQLQLALLDVEDGKGNEIDFDTIKYPSLNIPLPRNNAVQQWDDVTESPDTDYKAYTATIAEIRRCVEDRSLAPRRDGDIAIVLENNGALRTACAFFLGRISELNGHTEDAIWWYRTALDVRDWSSLARPQAVAALDRLEGDAE